MPSADSPRRSTSRRLPEVPEPAGFGNCGSCAYRSTGSIDTCYRCASSAFEKLAKNRCDFCEGKLKESGLCGNPLCNRTIDQRGWRYVHALSMRSGALKGAISAYKYDGKYGWGWIFGRVLAGYMAANEEVFRELYGVIIPMPTYTGEGGRSFDHTRFVLERAQLEDDSWPFRFDVMDKTAATPRLADAGRFANRAHIAETAIAPSLAVVNREAVSGQHVLVFDDVFTGGLTLREVARKLRAAGARSVDGIVLARQPFSR